MGRLLPHGRRADGPIGQSVTFSVTGPDGHTSHLPDHVAVTELPPVDEISIDDVDLCRGGCRRRSAGADAHAPQLQRPDGDGRGIHGRRQRSAWRTAITRPLSGFLVTFPPGVIEQKVRVDLLGDQAPEPNETFSVTISNPGGGAVIGRATATATILNDDENTISIGDASILEGAFGETPLLQVPVSLLNPTSQPITVAVNTADGTATTADFDYLPVQTLVLTFVPGGPLTQFVTIQVPGDGKVESDETLTVTLSNPTGSRVGLGRSTATATIVNDDATAISIGDETLPEGHGHGG